MKILADSEFFMSVTHIPTWIWQKNGRNCSKHIHVLMGTKEGVCACLCADTGMVLQMKWAQHSRGIKDMLGFGLEHFKMLDRFRAEQWRPFCPLLNTSQHCWW